MVRQDIPSLVAIDGSYANEHGTAYKGMPQFFQDVKTGALPSVSWLDPNFIDVGLLTDTIPTAIGDAIKDVGEKKDDHPYGYLDSANDDHPPADWLLDNAQPRMELGPFVRSSERSARDQRMRLDATSKVLRARGHADGVAKRGVVFPLSELQQQMAEVRARVGKSLKGRASPGSPPAGRPRARRP